jgi:hypothetical protein
LINLIFVFVYSQIEDKLDLSNELLNDKEIQKYMKSFEKIKRFFRSLDDTSESNEDSEESSGDESNELSSGDESNELSSGDESNELSSGDESNDVSSGDESNDVSSGDESNELSSGDESNELSSGDESNDVSSGEESNELSSGDESNDVSSGEESSGSEETGTSADTTTSTQNIDTDTSSGNQTISPTETPTPTPTPTPVPSPNYGYNSINILLFSNYHSTRSTSSYIRPVIITFTIHIVYRGYTPFSRVTFTLRLAFMLFRGLQESNETYTNTTSNCTFVSQDLETGICGYSCEADTDREPSSVESLNDYKFDNQSFELGNNFTISDLALENSNNLVFANSTISNIKTLENGVVFNNDSSTFSIRGQLKGVNSDTIPFTFVDKSKGEEDASLVNVRCNVTNKDENDFQIKCDPETDLQTYINGTVGVLDDDQTGVYLNMTEHQNYVNVRKSSNVVYRKNSSGLSGGAIAGIVIACAVILILISLIIMCIRKPKGPENNNSSVVGLRTVDNFTE